jgi:hypothetical protein
MSRGVCPGASSSSFPGWMLSFAPVTTSLKFSKQLINKNDTLINHSKRLKTLFQKSRISLVADPRRNKRMGKIILKP